MKFKKIRNSHVVKYEVMTVRCSRDYEISSQIVNYNVTAVRYKVTKYKIVRCSYIYEILRDLKSNVEI